MTGCRGQAFDNQGGQAMLAKILDAAAAVFGIIGTTALPGAIESGYFISPVLCLLMATMLYHGARKENGERNK